MHYEARAVHKNGNLIYVHITNSPIIVQNKIVGMYWIARDVTELKLKTDQLRENQELLELLTENVIDVISYINPDGICGYISPSVTTLLGYDPEELIGKNFIQHFHPDDLKEMQSLSMFDKITLTCRIRHKDGHYVWFESTVKTVCDPHGLPVTYIGIGRDITTRKSMEEQLRKSEESLKTAQKVARLGNWEWNLVQDERIWSDEMFSIFEINPDEFAANRKYSQQFVHPEDIQLCEQAFQDVFVNKKNKLNFRIITQNSTLKHLHIQGIVIDNDEGEPIRMHGTVQDISERVESHRLLEEALQRYTSLKEYNPDPVISLDKKGLYVSGNKAMERLTGYRNEELVGLHFSSIVSEEFHSIALELLQQVLSGAILEDTQMTIRIKQGQLVNVVTTPAPIVIDGHIVGCYIIAKDITEQKRKDELLLNTEKQTITGQLSAAIAHEIRNPMTAIKGFLKLMKTNGYKEEYVTILQEECNRIEIITNELLVLAKPQALKLNVRNVVVTVDQVIALIESQANMNSVSLIKAYEVQAVTVNCDENQVKQVFINIIKNAIEVMPKGGEVKIAVRRVDNSVVVAITDQGHGIPADKMAMLGQPFYSTKEKGTGLGLMVSYKIIENHKGRIHLISEVGKGTTFEIVLPVYEGAESEEVAQ